MSDTSTDLDEAAVVEMDDPVSDPPMPDPMAAARQELGDRSAITGIGSSSYAPTPEPSTSESGTNAFSEEDEAASTEPVSAEPASTEPDGVFETTTTAPYDRPGKWYVVHTQSGYEKKVKQNLEARMLALDLEDEIHEIEIPMEDVIEFKNGRKIVVKKKLFPGYLLIRCNNSEDVHTKIKETPGITGYAGPSGNPTPLKRREVESFLQTPEPGEEPQRRTKPSIIYEVDENVRIKDGPFSDFQGQVVEVNEEHLRVKVLVNIFGRETPVELEFAQVAKI